MFVKENPDRKKKWLTILSINAISDIAIITIENVDYCCIIYNITSSEVISLLKNYVLENRGNI